jgi:hypothetical protein
MAQRAIRDTYGYEPTGVNSPPVRRLVKAGQLIPAGITSLDDPGAAVEDRRTNLSYRLHNKAAGVEDVVIGTNKVRRGRARSEAPASAVSQTREAPGQGPKGATGP